VRVVAAVLAAGGSSRLGRPKQLLDFRGETLVAHAARVALGAGCDEVVVIMQPEMIAVLPDGARRIDNPQWTEGMAASVRAAARSADGARLLLTLVDQPLVTAEHLRELIAVDAPVVASGYAGVAGVPAVFAPELLRELASVSGERGAGRVIAAHGREAVVVPFEPASVDIDTEDDYRRVVT
jgi:molybdenum cofactor cytidylyltransferase